MNQNTDSNVTPGSNSGMSGGENQLEQGGTANIGQDTAKVDPQASDTPTGSDTQPM